MDRSGTARCAVSLDSRSSLGFNREPGVPMAEERPTGAAADLMSDRTAVSRAHWRDNLRIMSLLLTIWFVASYLLGIVFVEPLNAIKIGGFPLGFWFAQQGAIYIFMLLILVYAVWMDRVDRRHGVGVQGEPAEPAAARQDDSV
jgi:putative solute:sodium symporter small subunit